MSRTYHHKNQRSQHAGEDLWSKRANMGYCRYTTFNKRLTIGKERMEQKETLFKELTKLD